ILGIERELQVGFPNSSLLLSGNGPFNGHGLRPFHNRGNDRAADEIAAVKDFLASAAQCYFEEPVFITTHKLPVDEPFNQTLNRRADSISFLRQHTIVRQTISQIDAV